MIRDKRAFIAVSLVGVASCVFALCLQLLFPYQHSVFPRWLNVALLIFITGGFLFNIVLRMHGPIQPVRWARGLSDPQLWLIKGVLAAGAVIASVLLIYRLSGRAGY